MVYAAGMLKGVHNYSRAVVCESVSAHVSSVNHPDTKAIQSISGV